MAEVAQYFVLLSYMKKPKPWREVCIDNNSIRSRNEKIRTVNSICRRLLVNCAPDIFAKNEQLKVKGKKYRRKRKAEPPFLIRNCISGHRNWENYTKKMQYWKKVKRQRKENSFTCDFSKSSSDRTGFMDITNDPKELSSATSLSEANKMLLRSFYTVWHIRYISKKTFKTREDAENALRQLSLSSVVEKSMKVTPRGGIKAEVIEDKSKLSKRAIQTLNRWARVIENDLEDGYESGYSDDPVEVRHQTYSL
ncbi:unnamed protein product [Thelazia callipaeda]|uniref:TFIIS N-terminal domain-containing protein n=1 Tax=Thelazia callipaeda TaxID=103827 RepID=A0A0N5D7D6_THECL|nr:unnamed protein product [Thelazia callipaeda]